MELTVAVVGSLRVATNLSGLDLFKASLRQAAGSVGAVPPPAAMQVPGAPTVCWQRVLQAWLRVWF